MKSLIGDPLIVEGARNLKKMLEIKLYVPILAMVWTLCVASVFAGESVQAPAEVVSAGCEYGYPPFSIVEESGAHRLIHDQWLGVLLPRSVLFNTVLKYVSFGVAIILLVLIFSAVWFRSLKRQIAIHTLKLSDKTSKEHLSTLLQSFYAGVVVHAPDTKVIKCNKISQELLGLTEGQMIGKEAIDPAWQFCNEDGSKMSLEDYPVNQVITSKNVLRNCIAGVRRLNTSDITWLLVNAVPEFGSDGNIIQVVVTFINITERKQAEEELLAVSKLNKTIVDLSPLGILIYDSDGNCITANDAAANNLGAIKDELLQQNYHQLDSWKTSGLYDVALGAMEEKEKKHYEMRLTTTFGKTCILDEYLIPISLGNKPHLYIMFDNIIERKQSEEKLARFSRIFEDSLNEIYLFDEATLKFTQVNRAAQQNIGYTMDELKKMTPLDFKPEITPELFSKQLDSLRSGEKQKIVFETIHKRKDQSLYTVEFHSQLFKYEYETLFVSIGWDITERKQVEEELHKHRENLELLVKDRTKDLRKIVNAMSGREVRMAELKKENKELQEQLKNEGIVPDEKK